jgi:predicted TIM-barrel fold metal-dependent hydrolase
VLGADAFFLAASMPSGHPLATLSRGNDMRLGAIGQLLSRLPAQLTSKIAQENAVRLYRL